MIMSFSLRNFKPLVVPGAAEVYVLVSVEMDFPGNAPDAVEVGPPVWPAVIAPPRRGFDRSHIVVVLEYVHHRRFALVIGWSQL